MEFHLNFHKPTISKKVGVFLTDNLKSEKEKDLIQRIVSRRKLQYGDANLLLRVIHRQSPVKTPDLKTSK